MVIFRGKRYRLWTYSKYSIFINFVGAGYVLIPVLSCLSLYTCPVPKASAHLRLRGWKISPWRTWRSTKIPLAKSRPRNFFWSTMWASHYQDLSQTRNDSALLNWYWMVCKLIWFEQVSKRFPMDWTFFHFKCTNALRIPPIKNDSIVIPKMSLPQSADQIQCFGSDVAQLLLVQFVVLVWEGGHRWVKVVGAKDSPKK